MYRGTTRYNGNHNNLIASFGRITEQERQTIKTLILPKNGRSRTILEIARIHAGQWITFKELQEVSKPRFSGRFTEGSALYKKSLETLTKNNLIEHNPDHPQQFRITPFGMKFLYSKPMISKSR